ncbi:MAG: RNA methyltransferase [Gammaproteobacteria bacterium]
MPADIRIVLVETSHPGNIGAAARAMKVMGLARLVLVNPQCEIGSEARARASGAVDVLDAATTVPSLDAALEGARFVAGTSARARRLGPELLDLRAGAAELMTLPDVDEVAILFGPERTGLDNVALDCCNRLWRIPSSADYGSLNLAAAVQVVAYELRIARDDGNGSDSEPVEAAPAEEVAALCEHFERVAHRVESINPQAPRLALRRVQRLARRARPESSEVKLLRGFLSAVERATDPVMNSDEDES